MASKASADQLAANKKWNEKQYRMTLRMPPALKKELDEYLEKSGESATQFIIRLITENMRKGISD